ncbi:hypothetical protein [Nocardia sp. NPDC051570]|uniref:hypothetical protein n=1 Tax=Nocardia sp. NPDC051570 TaxID=3364324 RepID=UPI0037A937BC
MAADPDIVWLRELVDHHHAEAVLRALAAHPRTTVELAAARPGPELGSTVRMLLAEGLIHSETSGSWDSITAVPRVLRLTLRGACVVHSLAKSPVRQALNDR